MEKQSRRQQKTKKNTVSKKQQKILDEFNLLRVCTWLNLSTMEKNKEYSITNIARQTTKYGDRLMVELDGVFKLYLPERYNAITDNQLKIIGKNKYNLVNRGSQGKSYKLALTLKLNQSRRQQITKKYVIPKYKQNILKKFNSLRAFTWLNLSTMEMNKKYSITKIKRQTTQFGNRLMVELDGVCRLFLPERYNTLTNTQVRDIGRNKYNLLNRGRLDRSYILELSLKSNSEGTSTVQQEVVKQPTSIQQQFMIDSLTPQEMFLKILTNNYFKQQTFSLRSVAPSIGGVKCTKIDIVRCRNNKCKMRHQRAIFLARVGQEVMSSHDPFQIFRAMHTDLSSHLHTDKCNQLIKLLTECHNEHPIRKFIGYCNSLDYQMTKCLKEERLARRQRNIEKSKEMKEKLRKLLLEDEE